MSSTQSIKIVVLALLLLVSPSVYAQASMLPIRGAGGGAGSGPVGPTFVGPSPGSSIGVSTNGTDTQVAVNYSPTAGNCLLVTIGTSTAATISSVVDNASSANTYPLLSTSTNGNGGSGGTLLSRIYGLCNLVNVGTTITVSFTAGPKIVVAPLEYSNARLGQTTFNGSATSVATASNTLTTQAANNLLVGAFFMTAGGTPSANTGTVRQTACPTSCNASISGDSFAVADNTVSGLASVTTKINTGTSAPYAGAGLELSSNLTMNFTQLATNSCGSGNSCTTTFLGNPISGDALIVAFDLANAGSVSSVTHGTDTAAVCGSVTNDTGNGAKSAIYVFKNIATTGTTVTANFTGTPAFSDVQTIEVNGASTSAACDSTGTSANTEGGTTSTNLTPGTSTATSTKSIAFDYCSTAGSAGPWTFTSGWTTLVNTGGELFQAKYFSSVQSNLNPLITATTANDWQCQLASIASQ